MIKLNFGTFDSWMMNHVDRLAGRLQSNGWHYSDIQTFGGLGLFGISFAALFSPGFTSGLSWWISLAINLVVATGIGLTYRMMQSDKRHWDKQRFEKWLAFSSYIRTNLFGLRLAFSIFLVTIFVADGVVLAIKGVDVPTSVLLVAVFHTVAKILVQNLTGLMFLYLYGIVPMAPATRNERLARNAANQPVEASA